MEGHLDSSNVPQEQQYSTLKVTELLANEVLLVAVLMEENRESCQRSGQIILGLLPDGYDHPHSGVTLSVNETEREVAREDLDLPSGHEDGFKPNALLSNVAV